MNRAEGTIDCIVSDHEPHDIEAKQVEFNQAEPGIAALETAFAAANMGLGPDRLGALINALTVGPRKVMGLEQVIKEVENTIRLKWRRLDGASSFTVQIVSYSPGQPYPAPEDYRFEGNTTTTRYTIKGQRPGATFLVRVAGLGAKGQGTWSDPLTCIVV